MLFEDDYIEEKEFDSDRSCDFCNSSEGKIRKVGNYIVKLSPVDFEGKEKLACQGCKIKQRNFRKLQESTSQKKPIKFFRNLFGFGFRTRF